MLLPVLDAEQRAPVGLFDLEHGIAVEGGMVGQITKSKAAPRPPITDPDTHPVVRLFNPIGADGYGSDTNLGLVGLIDDSTTGAGYGTLFGSVQPFNRPATLVGPGTTKGSGKCTLWLEGGLFITDRFAATIDANTHVGTELRSIAGVLSDVNDSSVVVGQVIKVVTGGLGSISDLFGVILPRVQPLPATTTLMLFKFK